MSTALQLPHPAPDLPLEQVPTPCYVVDLGFLDKNLDVLADVQARSGAKILLALKGFAMWSVFDRIAKVLPGITASAPDEAQLGREHFGGEVHVCSPAYSESDLRTLLPLCDHIVFNSLSQWRRFAPTVRAHGERAGHPPGKRIELGLRINPEHSEVEVPLYDPCGPRSRLGVRRAELEGVELHDLDGLHFHSLCELGSDALQRTLAAVESEFAAFIPGRKWVNFGGGHHITRPDYDRELLVRLVTDFRERWKTEVYLEPGEAIALGTGVLVASVLDVLHNEVDIAILDASATCHMPDVLEMPYRPRIVGAGDPGEKPHLWRLGGPSCLAGDVIGDYSFDRPLRVGDKLVFMDMAHYTMVKNTTFNGVRLPSIATYDPSTRSVIVVRRFGYEDYASRLS
ncbi:carboxynorspermidine decarboxylase [Paraliomyxa miuraensis]|uniref:carboxynorspermidine decarboxylase n=1 Tax=Paraliomyxa miuraensis TaxID=376150 RepID=UPI0022525C5C|nr:carboxynorspermidine decarboxylase [Paraliomyxa miuraensis]MCX4241369.1 carboxynorspermidine decarboxylase [Paraliomyxa miuraensis]